MPADSGVSNLGFRSLGLRSQSLSFLLLMAPAKKKDIGEKILNTTFT